MARARRPTVWIRGGRAFATRREADLYRTKISKKSTIKTSTGISRNSAPPLLDDHCRQCGKPFKGKMAVLMHQKKVHTGEAEKRHSGLIPGIQLTQNIQNEFIPGTCCPVIVCGHNFKDESRMEAHIRRHVEEDVTGKLETDDEGDVVERRITRVTKRRIGNVFGQKQEKNVIEKSAKPVKQSHEELWKKCKCTRIDWRKCVAQYVREEEETVNGRREARRRDEERECEEEDEEEIEEEMEDSEEELANERVAKWLEAMPSNQGLEEEIEWIEIDDDEENNESEGSPVKKRRAMNGDDSERTAENTNERNSTSGDEEGEDESHATTEQEAITVGMAVDRPQNTEHYDADYETDTA
ncbi:hypothetical protein PRIPAC_87711 [Pristionchus pacificus]|uniref:Uncharacterized protein n=1 Tax=Pristionchus pacificus TaxID=54126 RepID=A0A2A6B9S3_PRIPA|nr:hypothetical protein PRIPAC_87711 [Pristionchus pacificus]|eukprot:PDM62626.1 hypothetical protein PRIPAC_52068 [Pristionchus pacificus]